MSIRRSAIALAMLTLVLMPRDGQSQGTSAGDKKKPAGSLSQNYPNPYNPDTYIDFTVGEEGCTDGKLHRVSLRVFNILTQQVAVPVVRGVVATGQKLANANLPCGKYTAFWNGKYEGTSREVSSGIYIFTLDIDGVRIKTVKTTVAK
jgi:hypothetical protein